MAYGGYFPQNYYQNNQPYYGNMQTAQQMQSQQASNNGINWVQGEAAAKSYPVAAGQSVLLMDSETSAFYIKSTDQSGMPQPLRIFDYTERKAEEPAAMIARGTASEYVSRAEFDEFKEDVKKSIKGIRKPNIEPEGEG